MPPATGISKHSPPPSQRPPSHHTSLQPQLLSNLDPTFPIRQQHSTAHLSSKLTNNVPTKGSGGSSGRDDAHRFDRRSGRIPPDPANPPLAQCATFSRPKGPILKLSPQTVAMLDPTNLESVYSLWAVFSRCSEALENGRRLENISWRLWSRELLFDTENEHVSTSTTVASDAPANPLNFLAERKLHTQKDGSDVSVPDLYQVPKLSSSVESSTSSCTNTSSNQKGSNDKLPTDNTGLPSYSTITPIHANNYPQGSALGSNTSRRRKSKQISSTRLQELLKLFNPDAQDDNWKTINAKRVLTAKLPPPPPQAAVHKLETESTSSSLRSQDSSTSRNSVTPTANTQLLSSNSSSNVARRHSSLFQNPSRPQTQNHQQHIQLNPSSFNKQNVSLKNNAAFKRNSQSSLHQPPKQSPDSTSQSSQGPIQNPSMFKKQSTKPGLNRYDSSQKLASASRVPSNLAMAHLATKSLANLAQLPPDKLQRTTSSFLPASRESTRRPSLFSRTSQLSHNLASSTKPDKPTTKDQLIPGDSSDEYSDSDSSGTDADAEVEAGADSDSGSGSDFEGIDSNGSRLTYKHRTSTSTSIVRGFTPSTISISAMPKASSSAAQLNSSIKYKPPAMFEMTKARPDKVPREKMFFIESSSPSDMEVGAHSLSSTSEFSDLQKNSATSNTDPTNIERQASLFSPQLSGTSKTQHSFSPELRPTSVPLKAVKENDDTEDDDEEDEDEYDDDSAWDSVDDESDSHSFDEKAFVKDDNKTKPLVRPSLLSSLFLNNPEKLMEEQEKHGSSSSTPMDRLYHSPEALPESQGISPEKRFASLGKPSAPVTQTLAMAARNPSQTSFTLLSPRTTRRNMLASELSESVRRDLLWERKQISRLNPMHTLSSSQNPQDTVTSATSELAAPDEESLEHNKGVSAKGKLVRRHTSSDVAQLNRKQMPTKLNLPGESWKADLDEESNGDFNYHARGW